MKKILLFCLVPLLLVSSLTANAQSNFQEGYIIKNDNKLIRGLIEFTGEDYTPSKCVFKWFDISQSSTYSPADIKSFGFVNGGRYESVKLNNKLIFISCFVKGKVNMLFDGKTMYVENNDIGIAPLSKKSVELNLPDGKVETDGYKDLLKKLLTNAPSFSVPEDIALNTNEIRNLIEKYNVSSKSETRVFATNKKDEFYSEMQNTGAYRYRYGVIAGMNACRYKTVKLEDRRNVFAPEMTFFEYTPVAGIYVNRQLSRIKEKFSVQAEIQVFRNRIYLYNEDNLHASYLSRSDINISYTGIKIPVFFQYNILKGKIVPFINAGGVYTRYFEGKYTRSGENETTGHVVRPFEDNSLALKTSDIMTIAGVGVTYKLNAKQYFFLNVRAESGTGIYNTTTFNQSTQSITVLAGFNF